MLGCYSTLVVAGGGKPPGDKGVGYYRVIGKPVMELGMGLSLMSPQDYPGSEERTNYLLPFPRVIYRGKYLRANRGGIRGLLASGERFELDLSIAGSLPVNSDDNRLREAMPDLGPSLEIGPSLRLKLLEEVSRAAQLRLNIRQLISFDDLPKSEVNGWLVNPSLVWFQHYGESMTVRYRLEARWGDQDFHHYFYSVSPQYATATRPAYQAQKGYGGVGVGVSMGWTINRDWRLSAGLRYFALSNTVFDDSPLFRRNHAVYYRFSVSRMLWRSTKKVGEN